MRAEKGAELDGAFTRIIHKATDELLDRLTNGDAVLIEGEVMRKPVSARDLALISGIAYDKRALARNEPTSIAGSDKVDSGDIWAFLEEVAKKKARDRGAPVDDCDDLPQSSAND